MYQSPIILCAAVVLFHGVSCHLFPAVLDSLTKVDHSNDYKRQSVAQLQECVSAGINVALSGNTPSFISNCSLAATQLITSSSSSAQSQINEIFSSFCIPQCGNITQDVYEDCGFFDVTPPGNKRYLAGLCGTNENGDKCYRMYSKAVTQVVSEENCFINNEASGGCNCRPLLLSTASNQGCCIDVYHARFISAQLSTYSPRKLYNDCNVDRPEDCNNSPISGSVSFASTVTLIIAMACFAALG